MGPSRSLITTELVNTSASMFWASVLKSALQNIVTHLVTRQEFMGSGLGEGVYCISRLQLQLQSLKNNDFQAM
jgi:hypothetical protein